jgi:hypothetical protein
MKTQTKKTAGPQITSEAAALAATVARGLAAEAQLAAVAPLAEEQAIADISASFGVAHRREQQSSTHDAIMASLGVTPRSES